MDSVELELLNGVDDEDAHCDVDGGQINIYRLVHLLGSSPSHLSSVSPLMP